MNSEEKIKNLLNAEDCLDEAIRNIIPFIDKNTELNCAYKILLESVDLLEDYENQITSENISLKDKAESDLLRGISNAKTAIDYFLNSHSNIDYDSLEYAKDCLGDALDLIMDIEGHKLRKFSQV